MDVEQQLWIWEFSKMVNFHAMRIQWALHVGKCLYRWSCDSGDSFHFAEFCQCPYLKISITGNFFLNKASQNSVFITQCILVGQL